MTKEELKARSPSHNAHRIRAAVMLVHGGRDLRTPLAHGHAMRDALEKAGKPVEWVFESAQGHGFAGNAARAELYERILAFLNTHIGEQPGSAAARLAIRGLRDAVGAAAQETPVPPKPQ